MPEVSIIIVSWNTRELLRDCLESIYNSLQTLAPDDLEIWVVDNVSQDGSLEMVADQFPGVRRIANKQNVGFAAGNNQALRECTGRYALLLNPDTVLFAGALEALITFLDANPRAAAAGSRYLNPDHSLQVSSYPFPTLGREFWRLLHLDRLWHFGVYDMQSWPLSEARQVEVLQGASLMLRKAALDQVGLLDESYFMYTEEVDLCYRLQQAGWTLYWVPGSVIVHYGGQSTTQVAEKMFLHLYQSKLKFFRKHHGPLAGTAYKLVLFFTSILRLILAPAAYLQPEEQKKRNLQLAGNYRRMLQLLPGW